MDLCTEASLQCDVCISVSIRICVNVHVYVVVYVCKHVQMSLYVDTRLLLYVIHVHVAMNIDLFFSFTEKSTLKAKIGNLYTCHCCYRNWFQHTLFFCAVFLVIHCFKYCFIDAFRMISERMADFGEVIIGKRIPFATRRVLLAGLFACWTFHPSRYLSGVHISAPVSP